MADARPVLKIKKITEFNLIGNFNIIRLPNGPPISEELLKGSIPSKCNALLKCGGCNRIISIVTHFSGKGICRIVYCGMIDLYDIRRESVMIRKSSEGTNVTMEKRTYYCGKCEPSSRHQNHEIDCDDPFSERNYVSSDTYKEADEAAGELDRGLDREKIRELDEMDEEIRQLWISKDHLQQLSCDDDCKGQCLTNVYFEYVQNKLFAVKRCQECNLNRFVYISNMSFNEVMTRVINDEGIKIYSVFCKQFLKTDINDYYCKRCCYTKYKANVLYGANVPDESKKLWDCDDTCQGECLDDNITLWKASWSIKNAGKQ